MAVSFIPCLGQESQNSGSLLFRLQESGYLAVSETSQPQNPSTGPLATHDAAATATIHLHSEVTMASGDLTARVCEDVHLVAGLEAGQEVSCKVAVD